MFIIGRDLQKIQTSCFRSGVIPFTYIDNKLYFMLAIDYKTSELTDFGGGCKQNESLIDTALRELHEESYNMFETYVNKEMLLNSIALVNHKRNIAVFFMYITSDWLSKAEGIFSDGFKKHDPSKLETKGIKWLSQDDFENLIYNSLNNCTNIIIWNRLKNFVIRNTCFNILRLKLLECNSKLLAYN